VVEAAGFRALEELFAVAAVDMEGPTVARVSSVGGPGFVVVGGGAIGGGGKGGQLKGESSASHSMRRRAVDEGAIVLPEDGQAAFGKCYRRLCGKVARGRMRVHTPRS
jgi:nucleoside phosphorylase